MSKLFASIPNRLFLLFCVFYTVSNLLGQPPAPEGMVYVPGEDFNFLVYNRWREGLNNEQFEMGPLGQ